jgi:hypothetical protein
LPKPKVLAPQAGMSDWDDPGAWTKSGDWYVRSGGEYVPFRVTPTAGTFVFTAKLQKGKRLQWFVHYKDSRNHALFQMDKKFFYRKQVINGKAIELAKVAHGLGEGGDLMATVQIDVRATSIVHNLRKNDQWVPLDTWSDPGGGFENGKFGFLIPGRDQYALLHFGYFAR